MISPAFREQLSKLWLLFSTFFKIAALVVGGGLAMLPVIEETFVQKKKLISQEDVLDMVTLSQTIPGIIAANSALFIGMKVAGIAGALAALFGAILPSFTVIVIIAWLFPQLDPDNIYLLGAFAGVRAGVTGMILVTAWKLAGKTLHSIASAVGAALAMLAVLWGFKAAWVIVAALLYGLIAALWMRFKMKRKEAAK